MYLEAKNTIATKAIKFPFIIDPLNYFLLPQIVEITYVVP